MEDNNIVLIHGSDYFNMTLKILEYTELEKMILKKCDSKLKSDIKIGIKPNLVAPILASEGATTHSEIVEGIVIYLKDRGFSDITIMESSWVGDRTEDAFDLCGYYDISDKYKVRLLDMKKDDVVDVEYDRMKLKVCKTPMSLDFIINVPVLKGHCQTKMTCALKNMKGLIPDSQKRLFHKMGLHKPIAALSSILKQDFILVDNICGDLSFEDGGNPVLQERLIAGTDPVLIDSFGCRVIGINYKEVSYIELAEKNGVGSAEIKEENVIYINKPIHEEYYKVNDKVFELSAIVEEVESCSACYGSLIPVLERLKNEGYDIKKAGTISIGQGYKGKCGRLGIGSCTSKFDKTLKGCPPEEDSMYEFLKNILDS